MQSMWDVTLSFLIGGMVLLSMFSAMATMQSQSINQQIYITLLRNAQNYNAILSNYYLANLGANHPSGSEPIVSASNHSFSFYSYIDSGTGTPADTRVTIGEQTISGQKNLLVYRNNNVNLKLFGPIPIRSDGLVFRYYDEDDNLLSSSPSLTDIYAVELGFYYRVEGINLTSNNALDLTNYVHIKKYLINKFK